MHMVSRLILAAALMAGLVPVFAQSPTPVPALPDTERRTTYSISNSTCACAVNFALYGDSTDYQNWIEVFVNGALMTQSGNWTITSPSGSLATLPRPITDAVLTFAVAQTGTVQIVGARRPRRVSQFSENAGVSARNLNQAITDIVAMLREDWDKINDVTGRAVLAAPGETLALLPKAASRANTGACFDTNGNLTSCVSVPTGSFIAGSGITLTGTNPTTIANNIQAGTGINITGTNPLVISAPPATITYTPPWTGAASYLQSKYNSNVVYMTDFMGTTTCDGTIFYATTTSGSPTLSIFSPSSTGVRQGTIAIGQTVGGPGIARGTTITGGSGTSWTMSANATVTTTSGFVSIFKSGTNQFTNIQNFLNAVATNGGANGANGGPITGVFAPGQCFVSGTSDLTFPFAGSQMAQQYHLVGYGSTISPDLSTGIDGLFINDTRGYPAVTRSPFSDALSGVTVEGLTIDMRNNTQAGFAFSSNLSNTIFLRNQIFGGSDSCSNPTFFTQQLNSTGLVGILLTGINEAQQEAGQGPIRNTIQGNLISGFGAPTGSTPECSFPIGIEMVGQTNATRIIENNIFQTVKAIVSQNACANTAGSPSGTPFINCIASANGVVVANNYFEALNFGIAFSATISGTFAPALWQTYGNRIENMCFAYMDLSQVSAASSFPFMLGPDMVVNGTTAACTSPKYLNNPNSVQFYEMTTTSKTTSLTTYP